MGARTRAPSTYTLGSMFGRAVNPEFRLPSPAYAARTYEPCGMLASTGCSFEQVVLGACR